MAIVGDIKPSALHDCLLAAEDKRFQRHTGLDYLSLTKALVDHFVYGDRLRGGSTISNQLVRTVILADHSRSILRKIREILLTNVAERHFSKDDLLLAYVNNVPVGHVDGRALVGLSAASEALFGKRDPRTLTLSEACTLAGMLNRPNGYLSEAGKGDYNGIIKRRNAVLENLSRSNPGRFTPRKPLSEPKGKKPGFSEIAKSRLRSPGNLSATPINSSRAKSRGSVSV